MTQFSDGLTNIHTGLGNTDRDKLAGTGYATPVEKSRKHWGDLVRSSGIARRIVSMPAEDATREWREWSAESADISKIEAEETRLDISAELKMAVEDQRAVGRGFVYFDLGDDPEQPANPSAVGRGGVRFVRYIDEASISDGDIEDDPMAEGYGLPRWYEILTTNSIQRIHPSRMIRLNGERILGGGGYTRRYDGVLRRCESAIIQHDLTRYNVAAMTSEAKVDVWTVKGLSDILSDPEQEAAFLKAAQTSNMMKGVHGMMLLEGGDQDQTNTYDQKTISFATLPDVIEKFEDGVASVAGFSREYLFTRVGGGLGDNGSSVLEMDYGKVGQIQKTQMQPAMSVFDECLIRSALGDRPADVHYNWRSLWSMSDADRAKIGLDIANRYKAIADADLLPVDVVSETLVNELTEKAGAQGLEAAYREFGSVTPDDDGDSDDDAMLDGYVRDWKPKEPENDPVVELLSDYLKSG